MPWAARTWRCNTASGSWPSSLATPKPCRSWSITTKRTTLPVPKRILNEVLANPKLDAHAPGRLLAEFELGKLYSGRLHQTEKAADAFAKVLAALDDKSANRLSPAELARVLGNDPATAYLNFGLVFLEAKKYDLAVKALERGLVYDEDNSQISLRPGRYSASSSTKATRHWR